MQTTGQQRIQALDVARGIAVLGILLANIHVFTSLRMGSISGDYLPIKSEVDEWLSAGVLALVTGKMRSMLAILFGAGLYLQFKSRVEKGTWPGGYLKRTAFLAVIGLIHALLIWLGDILFLYSMMAFAACWFVRVRTRWLAIIGAAIGSLWYVMGVGFLLMSFNATPAMTKQMDEQLAKFIADERHYASGTFGDQVMHRISYFLESLPQLVIFVILMLPLFLLGIVLARAKILEAPSKHPEFRKTALWVGLGAGIPLNMLAFLLPSIGGHGIAATSWEVFFGPLLAIGLLMAIAVWVESGGLAGLAGLFGQVGRAALSCYLLQSVICTFLFYSIGLGWFGKLSGLQCLGVVAIVWAVVIAFAVVWLKRFRMGPVEWLWRSATEGELLPLARNPVPAPAN